MKSLAFHLLFSDVVLTRQPRMFLRRLQIQVALRACEYARERSLYVETFIVSLQDETTGAPITPLKEVAARIANVFGISKQVCAAVVYDLTDTRLWLRSWLQRGTDVVYTLSNI